VFSGNRLYIVAVASLMVALLVASLMLELNAEARVANIKELATAQQRKSDVELYVRTIVDAETGQRGYLLTRDPIYLGPYEAARSNAGSTLDRVIDSYMFEDKGPPSVNVRNALQKLRELGTAKMDELAASLTLEESNRHDAALELVRTDYGLQTMDALRKVAADLDARSVGELNVEQRNVGVCERDASQRLLRRARLADHFDVVLGLEQLADATPHDLVVVEKEHGDRHPRHSGSSHASGRSVR